MSSRCVRSLCRINLPKRNYLYSRFKAVVTYSGSGTGGLCTIRYHSSTASDVKCTECAQQETKESVLQRFKWIGEKVPVFGVSGENVTVLPGPVEYFEELKNQARQASHRIVLASLYLGTSPKVQELVDTLYSRCQTSQTNGDRTPLKIHILLDCTRGSRGEHNSRTMLLPLLRDFPDATSVSLYHTPDLRGQLKKVIPERYNEVIGLSHIKAYIFDDTVIMSGANLSESYFSNRQDRYIMIKDCPQLADFFHKLAATVSTFSFQLQPDDSLVLNPQFNIHPFEGDVKEFKQKARCLVEKVIDPRYWKNNSSWHHKDELPSAIPKNTRSSMSDSTNYKSKAEELNYSCPELSHRILVDNRSKESRINKPVILLPQDDASKVSRTCQQAIHTDSCARLQQCDDSRTSKSNADSVLQTIQSSNISQSNSTKCTEQDSNDCVTSDLPVDTWIFPLVQMGPIGITVDEEVTSQILNEVDSGMECFLASGYFNLTRIYMDIILRSKAKFNILMASPQVNGFYGAKGISGYVPDSYTYIAKKFCEQRDSRGQQNRIQLYEYYRDHWTFHAKGLWIYLAGQTLPSLTLMGSPNFGHRSVHRDLEAQLAVITTNENLQMQLHQEQERLYDRSEKVDKMTYQQDHRKVALWVKIVSIVSRNFW